ncbi:hypothetical protein SBF1_1240004 [Candidatus Desulfosporosinus infrequens]|uniref:Rv2525c-like glycoside hydrolase-like domain-containing protein n=1 Tax=Candidatus Desulfosporosinus infrequens TaxID=2043169 RepID=A0A2U3K2B9_9FIRM|nr:hypothetical protein SBF1_1240004 [Candidatus Desulfosporosinus infrequens]
MEVMDCATRLNSQTAAAVKTAGITVVGRYLGYVTEGWSKAITQDELSAIHTAGLSVVLIWEGNPTSVGYFTAAQGVADAKQAITEGEYIGTPKGTAIYFTVDYDAQSADMAAIVQYFSGVRESLAGQYLVGAYGSFSVLTALKSSPYAPDKYWQTYAWSGGAVFPSNIYQFQNSVTIGGVSADEDTINTAPGAWPEIGNNTSEVENMTLQTLILYYGDADLPIAADLALHYGCPVIQASYATATLLSSAATKYQVGGATAPAGVTLLAGADRFATMKAVLKSLGEI